MRSTALRCPRLSEELRLFEPGFFFYALGYTPLRPTVLPPLQPPHTPASATAPWFRCAAGSRQARRCLRGTPRQGLPSFRRRLPWYRLPLLSVSVGFSFVLSAIPRCLRLRSVGSPLTCYAIRYATEGTLPQPSPHYGGQSASASSRRLRSSALWYAGNPGGARPPGFLSQYAASGRHIAARPSLRRQTAPGYCPCGR